MKKGHVISRVVYKQEGKVISDFTLCVINLKGLAAGRSNRVQVHEDSERIEHLNNVSKCMRFKTQDINFCDLGIKQACPEAENSLFL